MKGAYLFLVFVALWTKSGIAQQPDVEVGKLPNLQHGVSGTLFVRDTKTLVIRDFNYDGLGPGAFLYSFQPGQPRNHGEGLKIPVPGGNTGGRYPGSFLRGRRYVNELLVFRLPDGVDACDIGILTIWCQPFRAYFTSLTLSHETLFVNGGIGTTCALKRDADPCSMLDCPSHAECKVFAPTSEAYCDPSCGVDNGGCKKEELCQLNQVQCVRAPCPPVVECLAPTTPTPEVTTPTSLATTVPPTEEITPTEVAGRGVRVGKLPDNSAHDISGTVYFLDTKTILIEDFNFDGRGPNVFLYYYSPGQELTARGGGYKIDIPNGDSDGSFVRNRRLTDVELEIPLPDGVDVCDIGNLTIWCEPIGIFFSIFEVPQDIFVAGTEQCKLKGIVETTATTAVTEEITTTDSEDSTPTEAAGRGVTVGKLPDNSIHGISGTLHVLDTKTLLIEDFNFDGQGPDVFLYYYSPGQVPDENGGGFYIDVPNGDTDGGFIRGRRYKNENLLIPLPDGVDACDIGTLTIWCKPFTIFFSIVEIPQEIFMEGSEQCKLKPGLGTLVPFQCPARSSPVTDEGFVLGSLAIFIEAPPVSGYLIAIDNKTLLIKNLVLDAQGEDEFFFYVYGNFSGPGILIPYSADRDSLEPRKYEKEDVRVSLPDGLTVCDFTLWFRIERVTQLGNRTRATFVFTFPEDFFETLDDGTCIPKTDIEEDDDSEQFASSAADCSFDNCIPLHNQLQVSWTVRRSRSEIVFRLCGCESIDPNLNQYMGFGPSGSSSRTLMFGADPVIAWIDETSGPQAVDYHLSNYVQCRGGIGACPDEIDSSGSCTDDIHSVSGSREGGQQCVIFTKPYSTNDSTCDIPVDPDDQNQYIVWGVGGLGETAFKHFIRAEATDPPIHFGRRPLNQCSGPLQCQQCTEPFEAAKIEALDSTTFSVKIGPSGADRGYEAITGQVGWGIGLYINDTLVPELIVQRGSTYTFIVEAGDDSDDPANYHPVYITDDIHGSRLFKTLEEKQSERVFAGFDEDGNVTAAGRLCSCSETDLAAQTRESCGSREDYERYLDCSCRDGEPAILTWTPDEETPDVVYYQCAIHLNLGWRILVQDAPVVTTVPPTEVETTTTTIVTEEIATTDSEDSTTTEAAGRGVTVGKLPDNSIHGISGTLHVLDTKTLLIEDFNFDGQGPDVFLYYYSPGQVPDENGGGFYIDLPNGDTDGGFIRGRRYKDENLLIPLPDGVDACDIGTLTIWCKPFTIFFSIVEIPQEIFMEGSEQCKLKPGLGTLVPFQCPVRNSPVTDEGFVLGSLAIFIEAPPVTGYLIAIDNKTLLIKNLVLDAQGEDELFFYVYSNFSGPGILIPYSADRDSVEPRKYEKEDVRLSLPDGLTVCDFTLWFRIEREDQLGNRTRETFVFTFPEDFFEALDDGTCIPKTDVEEDDDLEQFASSAADCSFDNCIPLHNQLQVSWTVRRSRSEIVFRLCGCESIDPNLNQYMGFGPSGSSSRTLMFGADPVIAWIDETSGPQAVDYHLSNYVQCRGGIGACPDEIDSSGSCTDDIHSVSGSREGGQQCVIFTKPYSTNDSTCDIPVDPDNQNQYIVWGVGGLGETAFKHFIRAEATDPPIHFGRRPLNQCSGPLQCQQCTEPFEAAQIEALDSTTFSVKIGPSGADRGYEAITGQVGWGIGLYINDTLVPELIVQRGSTYTFIVEAGDDPDDPANYHPVYITDDIHGSRLFKTLEEKQSERVFAGFDEDGNVTAAGRLCSCSETDLAAQTRESCGSREDYERYLDCSCRDGEPAILTWTPDEETPDVVYYQCAIHLNLGWRILVQDAPVVTTVPPTEDPCSALECPRGSMCSIFVPTGEAFCDPSCDLDNGGCREDQLCSLLDVQCVRAPCPPSVQCKPKDPCSVVDCQSHAVCKVFEETGQAYCDPSCDVDNGGCEEGQICELLPTPCVPPGPCPPAVVCSENPCNLVDCPSHAQCKVFALTNEAFCDPSCDIDNGGCGDEETCRLVQPLCIREEPCPLAVVCTPNDPCALLDCPSHAECKVFAPTNETYCDPSCNVDNGGCEAGETCQLNQVQCVRAPCPPVVECLAPTTPTPEVTTPTPLDPCAVVRCRNGYICKVHETTNQAFCDPSCDLNNGGCPRRTHCILKPDRECEDGPCPPLRSCCPYPRCDMEFCGAKSTRRNMCTNPYGSGCGNDECPVTFCHTCYFSSNDNQLPDGCGSDCDDYSTQNKCARQWGTCIRRAHYTAYGQAWPSRGRLSENFRCYSPPCSS